MTPLKVVGGEGSMNILPPPPSQETKMFEPPPLQKKSDLSQNRILCPRQFLIGDPHMVTPPPPQKKQLLLISV